MESLILELFGLVPGWVRFGLLVLSVIAAGLWLANTIVGLLLRLHCRVRRLRRAFRRSRRSSARR